MKFMKTLGGVLCFLGGLAALLGIAATAAPMMESAQVSRVLDSFSVSSTVAWRNLLNTAALFCLNHNYILFGAGIGVLLTGGLMKTGASRALHAAHTSAPKEEAPAKPEKIETAKKDRGGKIQKAEKKARIQPKPEPAAAPAQAVEAAPGAPAAAPAQAVEAAPGAPAAGPRWIAAENVYPKEEAEAERPALGVLGAAIVQRIQTGQAVPENGLAPGAWQAIDDEPETLATQEPWTVPEAPASGTAAATPAGTNWYQKAVVSEPEAPAPQPKQEPPEAQAALADLFKRPAAIIEEQETAPRVDVTPREVYAPRETASVAEPVAAPAPVVPATTPAPVFRPDRPAETAAVPAAAAEEPAQAAPVKAVVQPLKAVVPEPGPAPAARPYLPEETVTFAPAASAAKPVQTAAQPPAAVPASAPAPAAGPYVPEETVPFAPAAGAAKPVQTAVKPPITAPAPAPAPAARPTAPVEAVAFDAGTGWAPPVRQAGGTQPAKPAQAGFAPAVQEGYGKREPAASAENQRIAERWQPQPVRAAKPERAAGGLQAAYAAWETNASVDDRVIVATRRQTVNRPAAPAQLQPAQPVYAQAAPVEPQQPTRLETPAGVPFQRPGPRDESTAAEAAYPSAQPAYAAGGLNAAYVPGSEPARFVRPPQQPAPAYEGEYYARPQPPAAPSYTAPPAYAAGGLNAAYVPELEPSRFVRPPQQPAPAYEGEYYTRQQPPAAPSYTAQPAYAAGGLNAAYAPGPEPPRFIRPPQQSAPAYEGEYYARPQPPAAPSYTAQPAYVAGGLNAAYAPEPEPARFVRPPQQPAPAYEGEYFARPQPPAAPSYTAQSAYGYRPNETDAAVYPAGRLGAARSPGAAGGETTRIVSTVQGARFDAQAETEANGPYAGAYGYTAPQPVRAETEHRIVSTVGRKSER